IPSRAPRLAAGATCRCASITPRTTFVHGLDRARISRPLRLRLLSTYASERGFGSAAKKLRERSPFSCAFLALQKRHKSFVAQRFHRINGRGPVRGNPASQQSHPAE